MSTFINRADGGRLLAAKLAAYKNKPDVIVLGLPRGGVMTATAVAQELGVALDVVIVRKLGVPYNPELAFGAIAEDGSCYIDQSVVTMARVLHEDIEDVKKQEQTVIDDRVRLWRGQRGFPNLKGKVVILVDDGIATGATMRVAIMMVKTCAPKKVIVAVPVIAGGAVAGLKKQVDEVVFVIAPEDFGGIGQFYNDFAQTTNEEVSLVLGGFGKE